MLNGDCNLNLVGDTFRIFNKLGDMKRILSANVTAFGPVINAMLFFAVTVAIYAVIAV